MKTFAVFNPAASWRPLWLFATAREAAVYAWGRRVDQLTFLKRINGQWEVIRVIGADVQASCDISRIASV